MWVSGADHDAHPSQKHPHRMLREHPLETGQVNTRRALSPRQQMGPKRRVPCRGFPLGLDHDKSNGVKGFRICKLLK